MNEIEPSATGTRLVMVPPPGQPAQVAEPARRSNFRLSPGQTIPGTNWRITRWLGEGNMGVVYEARHVEIDRRAAIKVVSASHTENPAAVVDFRSEARASAKIGAPNIVDVFDFAVLGDGRLMMAMEFVPGISLHAALVADGTFCAERLIAVFRQVCKGLQAAHDAGLVHRDIKPENIMVSEIGGRADTVKLVDFGIATMLGERTTTHAGTPYYMPPEGLLGGAIDGRYDIYSVGCVMFEMLTGRPPYVDAELERVLEMHAAAPIPSVRASRPELPAKLDEVVGRCLAKHPDDRFASMAELEAALCEAQIAADSSTAWDDLPLPDIDPDRRADLLGRMPDRAGPRRAISYWWAPILVAAGVLVGGAIALPMLGRDDNADSERAHATGSEIEAMVDRVHKAAARAYYVYPPVEDAQADTAFKVLAQLEGLDGPAAQAAADELRDELAATLVRLGDAIWEKPGGEPFALDFYVQAIMFDPMAEPARTRAGMSPGELRSLERKAVEGDFTESELIAVEPLQALAEADESVQHEKLAAIEASRRDRRRASATAQLDALLVEGTRTPKARPSEPSEPVGPVEAGQVPADEGAPQAPTVSQPGKKGAASAIVAQANAARKAAELNEAERLYHKALRIERNRVDALSGLGRVYYEQAKYAKSVQYYSMAVRRAGNVAGLRIALGDAYLKVLDYESALEQYRRAKALGSSKANKRIARVDELTGG